MVYYELDEHELRDMEQVKKITMYDYLETENLIKVKKLMMAIGDLLCEVESLKEKLEKEED